MHTSVAIRTPAASMRAAQQTGRLLVEHPRQDAALEFDDGDGGASPVRRPRGLQRDEPGAEDHEPDAGAQVAVQPRRIVQCPEPLHAGSLQSLDGWSGGA